MEPPYDGCYESRFVSHFWSGYSINGDIVALFLAASQLSMIS